MGGGPQDQRAQRPKRGRVGNAGSLCGGKQAGDDLCPETIQAQVQKTESKADPAGQAPHGGFGLNLRAHALPKLTDLENEGQTAGESREINYFFLLNSTISRP